MKKFILAILFVLVGCGESNPVIRYNNTNRIFGCTLYKKGLSVRDINELRNECIYTMLDVCGSRPSRKNIHTVDNEFFTQFTVKCEE